MKRILMRTSLCLLFAAVSLSTSVAFADAGDGVESSQFNLGVGLDLFTGINTNIFYEDGQGAQGETNAAPLLSLVPSLQLTTISPRDLDLSANADIGFDFFFGELASSQSSIAWNLGFGAHLFPMSSASFKLDANINRTNQPSNKQGDDNYTQNIFGVGGTLGIHPGGRALQAFLSYKVNLFRYDTFSNSEIFGGAFASTDLGSLNKTRHDVSGRLLYKFLPKTAAALLVNWNLFSYDQAQRTLPNSTISTSLLNVNSSPLRIKAGLNGLITEAISLRLFTGYGFGFYDGDRQPNGFLMDTELAYHFGIGRKSSVRVGYIRDFRDSTLGSFFNSDRIYLGYTQKLLNDKLVFLLDGGVDFRAYALEFSGGTDVSNASGSYNIPTDVSDTYFNVDASLNYQVTNWLNAGVSYNLLLNSTDSNSDVIAAARDLQGRDFTQHIIMLNAGIRY